MKLLVALLFLLFLAEGLQFTCYQSEVAGGLYGLCPLVDWRAARIVNSSEITEDAVLPVLPYTENRNLLLVGSFSFDKSVGMVRQGVELLRSDFIVLHRSFALVLRDLFPVLSGPL